MTIEEKRFQQALEDLKEAMEELRNVFNATKLSEIDKMRIHDWSIHGSPIPKHLGCLFPTAPTY